MKPIRRKFIKSCYDSINEIGYTYLKNTRFENKIVEFELFALLYFLLDLCLVSLFDIDDDEHKRIARQEMYNAFFIFGYDLHWFDLFSSEKEYGKAIDFRMDLYSRVTLENSFQDYSNGVDEFSGNYSLEEFKAIVLSGQKISKPVNSLNYDFSDFKLIEVQLIELAYKRVNSIAFYYENDLIKIRDHFISS